MDEELKRVIVEMVFDNAQFQQGVMNTIAAMTSLKKEADSGGDGKAFQQLQETVDSLNNKMSLLGYSIRNVFTDVVRKAGYAATNLIKSITIDPTKQGLSEYNEQIMSTQTLMANTGKSVDRVNAALDDLNLYADKTIYNFTQMTKNAGLFTAAIGNQEDALEKSTKALKGIGNWAAFAGADATTMARATYQLSQAASSGAIRLMDWRSIENAGGMGGAKYKQAFIDMAESMGTLKKGTVTLNTFRDSLQKGWLTADVFFSVMSKFADDPAMTDAATKVKTLAQLIDTLGEALGSGWSQSWRTIVGDFEEAKAFWTKWSDILSNIISESADARNKILSDWDEMGGRKSLIEALFSTFNALANVASVVKKSFTNIFPPITGKTLAMISYRIKMMTDNMTEFLKKSDFLKKVYIVFNGLFSIVGIGVEVVKALSKGLITLFDVATNDAGGFFDFILSLSIYIREMYEAIKVSDTLGYFINSLARFLGTLANVIFQVVLGILNFVPGMKSIVSILSEAVTLAVEAVQNGPDASTFQTLAEVVRTSADKLADVSKVLATFKDKISNFFDTVESKINYFKEKFAGPLEFIGNVFNTVVGRIVSAFDQLTSTDWSIIAGSTGIVGAIIILTNVLKNAKKNVPSILEQITGPIGEMITGIAKDTGVKNFLDSFSSMMGSVSKTLDTFTKSVQSDALLKIGKALLEMAGALFILSTIDPGGLATGLSGLFLTSQILSLTFAQMVKALEAWKYLDPKTLATIPIAISAIGSISRALLILAIAVKVMSIGDMYKTAAGFGMLMLAMVTLLDFVKKMQTWMGDSPKALNAAVKGITKLAVAVAILALSMKIVASIDIDKMVLSFLVIESLLLTMTNFIERMQKQENPASSINSAAAGIIAFGLAVGTLALSLRFLSGADPFKMLEAFGVIELMMLTMVAIFERLSNTLKGTQGISQALLALAAMSAAVAAFSLSIAVLANAPVDGIVAAAASIGGLIAIMTALVTVVSKFDSNTIGKMAAAGGVLSLLVASVMGIAMAIKLVSTISTDALIASLSALGVAIVALIGLTVLLAAAGAALVDSGAILIVVGMIGTLAGYTALALGFAASAALIGAGLILIAEGIRQLANIEPEEVLNAANSIVLAISAVLGSIVGFLPLLASGIMTGIIMAFTNMVGPIADALSLLIHRLGDQFLSEDLPYLIEVVINLIDSLIHSIENHIESIVGSLLNIYATIIYMLIVRWTEWLPPMLDAIAKLIVALVSGLSEAIDNNWENILKAVQNLMISIWAAIGLYLGSLGKMGSSVAKALLRGIESGITGEELNIEDLQNTIEQEMPDLEAMGKETGEMFDAGLAKGIQENADIVKKESQDLAQEGIIDPSKKVLDINSPSGEGEDEGMWFDEGVAKGIKENSDTVKDASKGLMNGVLDASTNALGNVLSKESSFQDLSLDGWKNYVGGMEDIVESYQSVKSNIFTQTEEMMVDTNKILEQMSGAPEIAKQMVKNAAGYDEKGYLKGTKTTAKKYYKESWVYDKDKNGVVHGARHEKVEVSAEEYAKLKKQKDEYLNDLKLSEETESSITTAAAEEDEDKKKKKLLSENKYWANLLKIRQNGADGIKYQDMELADFEEKVFDDMKDAMKSYQDTVGNNISKMKTATSLFSEVDWGFDPENPVTKEKLTKNLEDQITQLARFTNVVNSLNGRIDNTELRSMIQDMGVDSLEELEALNSMTEEELDHYEKLFEGKMEKAIAAGQVKSVEAKASALTQVNDILGTSFTDMDEVESMWNEHFSSLDQMISSSSANIGHNAVSGITEAMTDDEAQKDVTEATEANAEMLEEGEKEALGIHSPSDRLHDKVGVYARLGITTAFTDRDAETDYINTATRACQMLIGAFIGNALYLQELGAAIDQYVADGMNNNLTVIESAIQNMGMLISAAGRTLAGGSTPSVTPVWNGSNIQNGIAAMDKAFGATRTASLAASASTYDINTNKTITINDGKTVSAIEKLDKDITALWSQFNNLQVVMDGRALVGQIVAPMNQALGNYARQEARTGGM